MKSSKKLSEERSFPSTLMERGTSGRRLTAAFRKASAGGEERGGRGNPLQGENAPSWGRKRERRKEERSPPWERHWLARATWPDSR